MAQARRRHKSSGRTTSWFKDLKPIQSYSSVSRACLLAWELSILSPYLLVYSCSCSKAPSLRGQVPPCTLCFLSVNIQPDKHISCTPVTLEDPFKTDRVNTVATGSYFTPEVARSRLQMCSVCTAVKSDLQHCYLKLLGHQQKCLLTALCFSPLLLLCRQDHLKSRSNEN